MYKLSVNFMECKDCGTCELLLHKFREVYGGVILISDNSEDWPERRASAESVVNACPERAIRFVRVG